MNLLLDTCAILFLSMDAACVRPSTRRLVTNARQIFVSPISCAEVACLQERGKIELSVHWKPWFHRALEENRWQIVPIDLKAIEEAWSLPGEFHSDPVDRILTATARLRDWTLLTTDRKIHDYPHVNSKW